MMHRKTVTAVAGSMLVLGAASPAFASGPAFGPDRGPAGLGRVAPQGPIGSSPAQIAGPPVGSVVDAVKHTLENGELRNDKNLLGAGKYTDGRDRKSKSLLGGLPLHL
ncbi:hypothetical protein ACH4LN_14440 [Streptomyces albus]|uniref:hypothetical protein n=1 Tax=Streptomyces TaxID=1883 RepID=UPI00034EA675|nr:MULTISPECIES: hypothetical protein [Streptomyces]EPD94371.1 hypothetical protein HMPREF1486_02923 [Streptomyces sp. HPH0547]MDI6409292.1 hypothetical protein [Streptomyces albus]QID38229.1 hypothetical protein G3260_004828 [Streptomyces albus]UVN54786.1 hypothetical protein NR995_09830 [Streptomyces albus]GHJ24550.1 hypothetical protein TPA0909_61640 [Streptomyces albus]